MRRGQHEERSVVEATGSLLPTLPRQTQAIAIRGVGRSPDSSGWNWQARIAPRRAAPTNGMPCVVTATSQPALAKASPSAAQYELA